MRFDVRRRHSLGVHRQYLLFDILTDTGLVLFQKLRLEFSLPVPGHGYLYFSEAGFQPLAAVAVPAVVRFLVPVVVFAVAQFIVQLCIQPVFHELRNGFPEQILDVLHAADVAFL